MNLFFHHFNQPKVQLHSGNIGYSSVQVLHSRLASCEYARLEYWIFVYIENTSWKVMAYGILRTSC